MNNKSFFNVVPGDFVVARDVQWPGPGALWDVPSLRGNDESRIVRNMCPLEASMVIDASLRPEWFLVLACGMVGWVNRNYVDHIEAGTI